MEKARKRLGSKSNLCFVEARFHGTCRWHSTPLLLRLGNETIIAWCLHSIFGKCICSDQAAGHIAGAKFNTEMFSEGKIMKIQVLHWQSILAIYICKVISTPAISSTHTLRRPEVSTSDQIIFPEAMKPETCGKSGLWTFSASRNSSSSHWPHHHGPCTSFLHKVAHPPTKNQ